MAITELVKMGFAGGDDLDLALLQHLLFLRFQY
jgi:hypothetical protein